MEDYYQLLEVSRDADATVIRKAYHLLALRHHPDRNPGDPQAAERFRLVHEAYQVLSDSGRRAAYDRPFRAFYESYSSSPSLAMFMEVRVDRHSAKLNDEVELIFVFGPDGRFFRKPDLRGWYLASGPIVDHQLRSRSGQLVRETQLRYIVCPMRTGDLVIPPASIRYNHVEYLSEELRLHVSAHECFFKKGEQAGKDPFRVYLHREQLSSQTIYAKVLLHQHVVLIPRSDVATWYHKVGRWVKVAMAACGAGYAMLHGESGLIGFVMGSAFGGLNCHAMYRIMGIKSRFYYAHHHPLVQEYIEDGYYLGREPNEGLLGSKRWEFLKSLFV